MILIYSLIVLLVLLILAYLYKNGIDIFNYGRKKEGFAEAGAGASTADIETSASAAGTESAADIETSAKSEAGTSASQKAYNQATLQQTNEENNTVEKHKKILNSSLDMNKLQNQVNELLKLGGEAKNINESLKK